MVYFRKPGQFKNRRRYPQGGRKRRIGRGIRQIQRLATDVGKMKEAVNVEYKCFDTTKLDTLIPQCTNADIANNASWLPMALNVIPQGTTIKTREGASVRIKSLQHNCTINNSAAANLPCNVRIIFVIGLRPETPTTSLPTPQNLLDFEISTTTDPMRAMRNMSNRSAWSIISDKVYRMSAGPGSDGSIRDIKIYKKLNFHTEWGSSDNTGVNIRKNALWCMVFTDQTAEAKPRLSCQTRIRYIDN